MAPLCGDVAYELHSEMSGIIAKAFAHQDGDAESIGDKSSVLSDQFLTVLPDLGTCFGRMRKRP